ncbi:hypothetical protein AAD018_016900 [Aestuariibius insulae]
MSYEGYRTKRKAAMDLRRLLRSSSFRKTGRGETNLTLIEQRETSDGPVIAMGLFHDTSKPDWIMPKDKLDALLQELSQS